MNEPKSDRNQSLQITHSDFSRSLFGRDGRAFLSGESRPLVYEPERWQLLVITCLLATLFAAMPLAFPLSLNVFYVLCLLGMLAVFRQSAFLPVTDSEKTGLMIVLVFCLVSVFTFWINGMPDGGNQIVQARHGKYLLAIPVYFFFRSYILPNRMIWILATIIALELLVIAIFDRTSESVFAWPGRASGNTHPVYFAVESLMMVALILAFRDEWSQKPWPRRLARLGLLSAFLALWLTGSSGVLMALPFVVVLYVLSRKDSILLRHFLGVSVLIGALLVILAQVPGIQDRMRVDMNGSWGASSSETAQGESALPVSARAEVWKVAGKMIMENPFLGLGTGGFESRAQQLYSEGGWTAAVTAYPGPLNQYLSAWATRGIVGLLAAALILLAPFLYCLKFRNESEFDENRQLAVASMMVVVVFLITGITEDVLEKKPLIILYLTTMALLLGQIRHRSRHNGL